MLPRSGEVVNLTKDASVQFASPILFRVIRRLEWSTYDGWVWLDGYELNRAGDAVERRSVFVQIAGLRLAEKKPDPRSRNERPTPPSRFPQRTGVRSAAGQQPETRRATWQRTGGNNNKR